jgi:hypothetical protein
VTTFEPPAVFACSIAAISEALSPVDPAQVAGKVAAGALAGAAARTSRATVTGA